MKDHTDKRGKHKPSSYDKLTPAELYELVEVCGDRLALTFLYFAFEPKTFALCRRILKDDDLAKEITQQRFTDLLNFYIEGKRYKPKNFAFWFMRGTTYACYAELKRQQRLCSLDACASHSHPEPGPDSTLDAEIMSDLFHQALGNNQKLQRCHRPPICRDDP